MPMGETSSPRRRRRRRPLRGRAALVTVPGVLLLVSAGLAFQVTWSRTAHDLASPATHGGPTEASADGEKTAEDGTSPTPDASEPSVAPSREVPQSGSGTFRTAQVMAAPTGSGPDVGYAVMVETDSRLDVEATAREIAAILAHPRGWAAHGRGTFHQTEPDQADLIIKIATPATADRLCAAYGLNTGGELNCETPDGVVVNLRRWQTGSPQFDGTAEDYRPLIVNHEVGHFIGLAQHLDCPGAGRPAPVMMQQIKGLHGCRSNAWPYDENGTYIDDPPAA